MVKYVKKSTRTSKKSVTKQAKAVVKASKMLMLRSVETKYENPAFDQVLADNAIYAVSPTQRIVQGNTSVTRVGDSILLQSINISGRFRILAACLNMKYRILIGFTRNQTTNTSLATGVIGTTDVFYATGATQRNADKIVNPAIFTSIYDEMFVVNSNTTTGQDISSFYSTVNLKMKKFDYAAAGGSLGKLNNLVVLIVGDSPSPVTGNLGTCTFATLLKFKDP